MDPLKTFFDGLRNRARRFGDAMLRLTVLDDASMDLEEAELREELRRLDPHGGANTAADPKGRAIMRAWDALGAAEGWRP